MAAFYYGTHEMMVFVAFFYFEYHIASQTTLVRLPVLFAAILDFEKTRRFVKTGIKLVTIGIAKKMRDNSFRFFTRLSAHGKQSVILLRKRSGITPII